MCMISWIFVSITPGADIRCLFESSDYSKMLKGRQPKQTIILTGPWSSCQFP